MNKGDFCLYIDELFDEQVIKTPDVTAIISGDQKLSYSQLLNRVNRLAGHIQLNFPDESIIGISATRCMDTIVAIMSIWKAGKAYLPLDKDFPHERLSEIISDAGLEVCFTPSQEMDFFKELINVITTDDLGNDMAPLQLNNRTDLAYVLYTSGSTGKPKGVCVGHQGIVNLIECHRKLSPYLGIGSRTLSFSPLLFDVSIMEICCTICSGGTLVLVEEATRLDPFALLRFIQDHQIHRLSLPFVALQYLTEAAAEIQLFPNSLMEVITAGEQLKITPQIRHFFQQLENTVFYNMYGPTEASVFTTVLKLEESPVDWPLLPSIGVPLDGFQLFILDDELNEVEEGTEGELCISGTGLALGYLNRPELNSEKFLNWKSASGEVFRIYRSGDRCLKSDEGNIVFLGRKDGQIKISGNRVEIGEIEARLAELEGISQAVVIMREDKPGQKQLVAYLKPVSVEISRSVLRTSLSVHLPDYMIPGTFVWLNDFARTSTGKIDRSLLPKPNRERPYLSVLYVAPSTEIEQRIALIWSELLQLDEIGTIDNFFELGGSSLLAMKVVSSLFSNYGFKVPITKLYQYSTIKSLADYLSLGEVNTNLVLTDTIDRADNKDIAVIGMAVRFPGANSLTELWDLLVNSRETTSFFTEIELDEQVPEKIRNLPNYVKARGIVEQSGNFDAGFFGIQPRQAELMDPQHRIFLELAWEALESTGYIPQNFSGEIGVFAGAGNNTYYLKNVLSNPDLVSEVGSFLVSTLNEKDYLATRVAYELDLKGPAVNVQSACSTSLLAIAQAVDSIRNGQCEIALAGGISIHSPIKSGHLYQPGAMLSPDGHCRSFDADADGTVFSDGAGIVVLKSLEAAERDGDFIYGVVKGIGTNNDGRVKGSFTAPSAVGQAGAIAKAIADSGINAREISYIEAHGTATSLGDPIEIDGLKLAFGNQSENQFCAIGSIKSNMGHLVAAAGVAGFIKTILSIHYKFLPASLFYKNPNPNIDFENSPFYVNSNLKKWESLSLRTAGVSSFGVGGTNVHVILQEYQNKVMPNVEQHAVSPFAWSAKSKDSLLQYSKKLALYLKEARDEDLPAIAHALLTSRGEFPERAFVTAANKSELLEKLVNFNTSSSTSKTIKRLAPVVFMFPGQGAQYANMGGDLYLHEPIFSAAVDECFSHLKGTEHKDLFKIMFASDESENGKDINYTLYAQPALFITSYALARLWMSWGLEPVAFIGHSIGEFVAAHLSGIFSLADVLMLVTTRARLIGELPGGAMLSIRIAENDLIEIIPSDLSVAAINSQQLCVVAGSIDAVSAFSAKLKTLNIPFVLLKTSHAFHSSMMEPAVERFEQVLKNVRINPPQKPIVSTVTGTWMTSETALDASYWAAHLRNKVNFAKAVKTLTSDQNYLLLEVGPGRTLSTLALQQVRNNVAAVISGLENNGSELNSVMNAAGKLWLNGINLNWQTIYRTRARSQVKLPAYAFDHKEYWIRPNEIAFNSVAASTTLQNNQQFVVDKDVVITELTSLFEAASGIEMQNLSIELTFAELGFDSLMLTQIATKIKQAFEVPLTFRNLFSTYNSISLLSVYIHELRPDLLKGNEADVSPAVKVISDPSVDGETTTSKPFGAAAKIETAIRQLSEKQEAFIQKLQFDYNQKTKKSKETTQEHRSYMADPRVVSGFRPLTKELVYPITIKRSKGARLWDLDGNEYIDALNGFGSSMLGYQPEFITKALHQQIDLGYEIGPQHELAGEVSKLLCEFTGLDRAALCNTGSEAVLGAMRIARSVTGRSIIVAFSGSYHGIVDEVIVRGTTKLKTLPAASGILPEAVQNMLILDYGTEAAIQIIKERAHEIAAVLVEPVQSRRPDFQPIVFLKELRSITADHNIALIFDEVITGFRMHPGGAQAMFEIKADIATYGKVIGGGISIGVIAGTKTYMDALDGGYWEYGNESVPESGVTYFAGTFVRHPLALAATKASLLHLKEKGPSLQEGLSLLTESMMNTMNQFCIDEGIPMQVVGFGSLWRLKFLEELPYGELLFTLMRFKGIHILDGFPCFMTTAHSESDVSAIVNAFKESTTAMKEAGFFGDRPNEILSPITESQLEIWTSCMIGGAAASCAYNDSFSLLLEGELNETALRKALQKLVDRHESLRMHFAADGRNLIIQDSVNLEVAFYNLSDKSSSEREEIIDAYRLKVSGTEFDLLRGPLFRVALFKNSPKSHQLKLMMHHIICDGWSVGVIMQELSKLYNAFANDLSPSLPSPISFADYAKKQNELRKKVEYKNTEKYWLEQFNSPMQAMDLPVDRKRPALRTYDSTRVDFPLNPQLTTDLKSRARSLGSSFVTTVLAAFEILLSKLCHQEDIVLGLPAAGQSYDGVYGLVGHCVNLLPLKSHVKGNTTLESYLKDRTNAVLEAYDHQEYTFGSLLKKLNLPRDPSKLPLIPVIFNVDIGMEDGVYFHELEYTYINDPRSYETFEIFLNISNRKDQFFLEWSYNKNLFDSSTIESMMSQYEVILREFAYSQGTKIEELNFDQDSSLSGASLIFGATVTHSSKFRLNQYISDIAKTSPDQAALSFRSITYSYRDLDLEANRFANLLHKKGVVQGTKIAICVDRSPKLLISILGAIKAGAVYIPIDPSFPDQRVTYMLMDSQADYLIISRAHSNTSPTLAKELIIEDIWSELENCSEREPVIELLENEPLYILYTSGSTGQPKGVQISHQNIINFLFSMQRRPGLNPQDRLLAITTVSFDISGLELFLPLITGATIILTGSEEAKDGRLLLDLIRKEKVSVMQATPFTWRILLEAGWAEEKIKAICGGEALPLDLAKRILDRTDSLWNVYGPTETTIWSTIKQITKEDDVISIGSPIDNTNIYVLDDEMNPVEKGKVGEIFIGGLGVSQGYLGRPELNARHFLSDPFIMNKETQMYRTGDLAKLVSEEDLVYISRADQQIKVKGYRIETGEIEHHLQNDDRIKQAVVLAIPDHQGVNQLIAFLTVTVHKNDEFLTALKSSLMEVLPNYMIPDHLQILQEMPLTLNGKIDKKALSDYQFERKIEEKHFIAPRTDVEMMVADIWKDCLGIKKVGIYDNFFELGGHSLSALQVMAKIEQKTGLKLPIALLFENSTVAQLALTLQLDGQSVTWDSLVPIKPKGHKVPIYIVHGAGLNVLLFSTLARHMDQDQPVYGLQAKGLDGIDQPLDRIEEIAAYYIAAIQKQNPNGPYALAGYSFGGIIAYEMTRQLREMGKKVSMLAMFDTYAYRTPHYDPTILKYINKGLYFGRKLWYSVTFQEGVRKTFINRGNSFKMGMTRFLWKVRYGKKQDQPGLFGYSNKIDESNDLASKFYKITPMDVKIELFRAEEHSFYLDDFEFMGWKPYALKGVNIHSVPGEHNTIFKAPNDEVFAKILQDCLNKIND